MNIEYRKATSQDKNELFPLAEKLATSFTPNKRDFSRVFSELLQNPNVDILIAETDLKLIGYVLAFHHPAFFANGTVSWVEELFVLEEYRGKDIGKCMMEKIEELASVRGSKLVALATRRAHNFYNAIGYDESATYFKKTFVTNNV
ncbi:N-acetyltransferase [Bacillus sp. J14TS2]|uniref:GNAT family N-acetyltransferase n=1 Tax=Bacillus sp. J14TS2 TaxID=2807188 RepID=UPI001B0B503B|nr:GNAT family N-acetyltransferase [Bacillus sp. J14TS2]GIN72619.1 N-acetyltransferase [Bacillus sp. J14TS2]